MRRRRVAASPEGRPGNCGAAYRPDETQAEAGISD